MCAVEWDVRGSIRRDTIVGRLVYDGGVLVDTVRGTGRWNTMAQDGDRLFISACSIGDQQDTPVVFLSGDYPDNEASGNCAAIDVVAGHQ